MMRNVHAPHSDDCLSYYVLKMNKNYVYVTSTFNYEDIKGTLSLGNCVF